ncbi:MAG: topology modulation protein, partial [Beijerinckiaceae bacterium]
ALGLPVIHIDQLFWRTGWKPAPREEYFAAMQGVVDTDCWIIEGANLSTLPMRLPRADTLVWFKRGRLLCLWRVVKRVAITYGRVRPDMAAGCPERFDFAFLKWIWNFERTYAGQAEALIAAHGQHLRIVEIRKDADAEAFLRGLAGP